MQCPDDVFRKLKLALNDGWSDDPEVISFAYEAISEIDWTGTISADIPPMPDQILESWEELEAWLESICPSISLEEFSEIDFDWYEDDAPAPDTIFTSCDELKERALEVLNESSDASVGYAEVTDGTTVLFLLYEDMDAWTLGHASSIGIASSLEDLTEENGYY